MPSNYRERYTGRTSDSNLPGEAGLGLLRNDASLVSGPDFPMRRMQDPLLQPGVADNDIHVHDIRRTVGYAEHTNTVAEDTVSIRPEQMQLIMAAVERRLMASAQTSTNEPSRTTSTFTLAALEQALQSLADVPVPTRYAPSGNGTIIGSNRTVTIGARGNGFGVAGANRTVSAYAALATVGSNVGTSRHPSPLRSGLTYAALEDQEPEDL